MLCRYVYGLCFFIFLRTLLFCWVAHPFGDYFLLFVILQIANNRVHGLEHESKEKNATLKVAMDRVKLLEEAHAKLDTEKAALQETTQVLQREKEWLIREGFSLAVDVARGSNEFVNAIVAMKEAAEMVGRHDGLFLGFNAAKVDKVLQELKACNPEALGLLCLQKKAAFDDMSFPLLVELKAMADDPDISCLKDLLVSDSE